MTGSRHIRKNYETLLLVPVIVLIICSTSFIGIGYSAYSSDAINSGNQVNFVLKDSHLTPLGSTASMVKTLVPELIIINGIEYLQYNIELDPLPGFLQSKNVKFELDGEFFLYITGANVGNVYIENIIDKKAPLWPFQGYLTINDGKFSSKYNSLSDIIQKESWIETNGVVKSEIKIFNSETFMFIFKK